MLCHISKKTLVNDCHHSSRMISERNSVANYLRMRHCDVLKWQRGHNGAASSRLQRFHLVVSWNDECTASRGSGITKICATRFNITLRFSLINNFFFHRGSYPSIVTITRILHCVCFHATFLLNIRKLFIILVKQVTKQSIFIHFGASRVIRSRQPAPKRSIKEQILFSLFFNIQLNV